MKQLLLTYFVASLAWASFDFLPESRHQPLIPFAVFSEEQTGLVFRDSKNAYAFLGGHFALVDNKDWWASPQLVLTGTVQTSFYSKSWLLDFGTETFDARFGAYVDFTPTEEISFSVGLLHLSGHAADGIRNPELITPNMGDDLFVVRGVYDSLSYWRVGATFKPLINSDPAAKAFSADQFVELFPLGRQRNHAMNPFLAASVEESGRLKTDLTFHAQLGIYYGNHRERLKMPALRIVAGYYNGWDPKLKYTAFYNNRTHFFYFGGLISL